MQRNSLIDGWRGLSVALVIVGHLVGFRFQETFEAHSFRSVFGDGHFEWVELFKQAALRLLPPLPETGVRIFFITSGFLITSLLIKEYSENKKISILAFYIRRACRILPAFLLFLLTMYVMTQFGVMLIPAKSFIVSSFFLCDLPDASCTWWLGHTWTLSVEEQFYFVWPAFFVLVGPWRVKGIAVILGALIAASFFVPIAISFAFIAIGALYASSTQMRSIVDRVGTGSAISLFSFVIITRPFWASIGNVYKIIGAIEPLMLAIIFFGTLNGRGFFVPILKNQWLQKFGVMSYSVYLWQQVFTGKSELHGNQFLLSVPVLFFVPAILSFVFVERPFIALGHHLSEFIKSRSGLSLR